MRLGRIERFESDKNIPRATTKRLVCILFYDLWYLSAYWDAMYPIYKLDSSATFNCISIKVHKSPFGCVGFISEVCYSAKSSYTYSKGMKMRTCMNI